MVEEAGLETEGMAETTSQLQQKLLALTDGKVDIMIDANTFKNTTQILREMAEEWDNLTDVEQAAALELLGGKRQANTLAAILTNFDIVEDAIESSANSAGSALEENAKVLDSIQGRINLFNNALQTFWNNLLSSDLIKAVVSHGTKIIQSLDTVQGKILGITKAIAVWMAYKKINPLDWIVQIQQRLSTVDQGSGLGAYAQALLGIGNATKVVTAETIANTIATQTNDVAKQKAMLDTMGLTNVTGALSAQQKAASASAIMQAVNQGTLSMQTGQSMLAMLGYGASIGVVDGEIKILDVTTKSFMATNPVGWILLIVSAVISLVTWISTWDSETEKLTKELDELKSNLSDIQNELDSVNSELETTKSRMAELSALPSLSFVEQEELNKLKETNAELERKERLLQAQEEREKRMVAEQAAETVKSQLADTSYSGEWYDILLNALENGAGGAIAGYLVGNVPGAIVGGIGGLLTGAQMEWSRRQISTEDKLNQEMERYKELSAKKKELEKKLEDVSKEEDAYEATGWFGWGKSKYDQTKEELDNVKKEFDETETYIYNTLKQIETNLKDVEYGYGADEILSLFDNLQYEFEIASGTIGAEADAIANIFNRPEYKEIYDEIKRLQGELAKDPGNSTYLTQISEQCAKAAADLDAVGLSADKAYEYFTMKGSTFDNSVEGIMAQYQTAKQALEDLKTHKINLDDLVEYDADTNTATAKVDEIAEHLEGVRPEIRQKFANIIEDVREGTIEYQQAFETLDIYSMQDMVSYAKTQLESANKLAFPDLEISGMIDSVEELKGAFDSLASSMDLINTAQKQMESSGRISLKTALDIMSATDQWNEILEINNGVITMNANAEQILIQSKLDLLKANIETELQQVKSDIALMEGAINASEAGDAFTEGFTNALIECQGIMVGLKAGWDAFWSGQDIGQAFNNARNSTLKNLKPTEQNVSELYKKLAELEDKKAAFEDWDVEDFQNYYDFNTTPGDAYTEKTGWEKLTDKYENELALITNERDLIEAEIDRMEAQGGKASTQYYKDLIRNSAEEKTLLEKKKQALEDYLEEYANSIDPDTWTEYNNEINATAVAIKECTTNLLEYYDVLEEIDSHYFEQAMDDVSRLGEEIEFVQGLLEDEDVVDENGNWTSAGFTNLGLYVNEMERAAASADAYKQKIKNAEGSWADYQELLANAEDVNKDGIIDAEDIPTEELDNLYDTYGYVITSEEEYKEKTDDLTDSMRSEIDAYNAAKDGIVEMNEARIDAIKEGIEQEIEAYEDYIDTVKEALDAERD